MFDFESEYQKKNFVWNTQRRILIQELTIGEWDKMRKPMEALELIKLKSIVENGTNNR